LAYNTFFAEPQRSKKRTTGSVKKVKAVVVNDKPVDYPNVKPYEEEWIPAQHLKSRPGKVRKDAKGDVIIVEGETSAGEVTSGGESGREGTPRKRKGKKA
jgi:translocon-associated protein subunit alpha